ncbi:: Unstab_antitox [Gemmataceae bacterium]|nr:: Unstab_antitox [Gemmataceae bacterium]VTU02695.1 : Unstab_antitox [Gemmataceae bacterium]
MSEAAAKLLEQVLALPEEERAFIVDRLTETLGDDGLEHDPAFEAELNRRLREVEEHPERLIDGEQVFREARERLQKRRQP